MENQREKRKPLDHVALTEASSHKISSWLEFISAKKKGVKISRKDFINWLIERLPSTPLAGDFNALVERFYDEEKMLRELLREVKRAKELGQTASPLELVVKSRKQEPKRENSQSDEAPSS